MDLGVQPALLPVVMQNLEDGSIKKLWPFEEYKKFLSKERVAFFPRPGKR